MGLWFWKSKQKSFIFEALSHDPTGPSQERQRALCAYLFFQESFSYRWNNFATGYYCFCITWSFLSLAFQMRTEQRQRLHSQPTSCYCPEVAAPRHSPQCLDLFFSLTHIHADMLRPMRCSVSGAGPLFNYIRLNKAQMINIVCLFITQEQN